MFEVGKNIHEERKTRLLYLTSQRADWLLDTPRQTNVFVHTHLPPIWIHATSFAVAVQRLLLTFALVILEMVARKTSKPTQFCLYQSHKQELKAVLVGHDACHSLVPPARGLDMRLRLRDIMQRVWMFIASQTYRRRFRCELVQSRPVAVAPSHVDDMSYGSLREGTHVLKSVVTQSVVSKGGGSETSRFKEKHIPSRR